MSAPQSYYVPVDAGEAEFTEKRSHFLGHVRRVETEAEARAFLDEMRKKYYDARHNCWCYVLHEGGAVRYGVMVLFAAAVWPMVFAPLCRALEKRVY